MSTEDRPLDQKAELREVAGEYAAAMEAAGCRPNCGVVFGDVPHPAEPQTHGYLLDDRRPGAGGERYLVLRDGDVWRASAEQGEGSSALSAAVAAWMEAPEDDLVTLLARSLTDAQLGGSGWLATGASPVERVGDRRGERRRSESPERRGL